MPILTIVLLLLAILALILAALGHSQVGVILLAVCLIVLLAVGTPGPVVKL